jgi:uncharacterized protein YydD (DUF2326 family)
MIKSVKSTNKDFKDVHFKNGFNVVLAERTLQSTDKDSRNGVGKSTLIDIIHFCLGADLDKNSFLFTLKGYSFILELELNGKTFSAQRSIDDPSFVQMEGDYSGLIVQPEFNELYRANVLTEEEWKKCLGTSLFNLTVDKNSKYRPSFRTLISYFARKGLGSFNDPFKYFTGQKSWSVQANNSYLLGLNVDYAIEFQKFKDEKDSIDNIKKLINDESLNDIIGSMGELQAERVRLTEEGIELDKQIKSFKVHPQYKKIQDDANKLTEDIHLILNQINLNQRILTEYEDSLVVEEDISIDKVVEVYSEAGLVFGEAVVGRLGDVQNFHRSIIKNRKEYLTNEIQRINLEISSFTKEIEKLSENRAGLIAVLETHSALDEYSYMQNRQSEVKRKLENVKLAVNRLNKFEENKSNMKIRLEELLQNARLDLNERNEVVDKAVSLFNQYSKYLYSNAGTLSINIDKSGYKFKVDIKSSQSQGIQYMKVFCYDLTFAAIQSSNLGSLFLIHDSTIFDGVDERQVAKALELAYAESKDKGYQYICTLNSDNIPYKDFSADFKEEFDKSVRLTLKDGDERGTLLGFRV